MNENMNQYLEKAKVLIEHCRISNGLTGRSSL